MANLLKMDKIHAIIGLHRNGKKIRAIARELGIDRKAVRRYIKEEERKAISKGTTKVPTGDSSKGTTKVPTGKRKVKRRCEVHKDLIENWIKKGLQAQRIFQDLRDDHGYLGGYDSVKRYVHDYKQEHPKRVFRMECAPGEEAQIDFGTVRVLEGKKNHKKQAHVLRVTLSFSRKSYSEAVTAQTTENFIRILENAFRYFGGVPETLCPDNLKAAVIKADWYEPELNPKTESFCRHYNTVLLPTRPRTPEHKGKVESGIKYVQDNALKGRVFKGLNELNQHLLDWESNIADQRIHGTTRQQVKEYFEKEEKPSLRKLPESLFPCFAEGSRKVHRDSYVEVEKSYYQVPCEYIGREVWVRWDNRMVRIYNHKMDQIHAFSKLEAGKFSWTLGVQGTPKGINNSLDYYVGQINRFGAHSGTWAKIVRENRKEQSLRMFQGVISLSGKYTHRQIDQACRKALIHGHYRLKDLRRWLEDPAEQQVLSFLQEHELIRGINEYGSFVSSELFEPIN